jgi:mannonate dehydratase
MIRYHPFALVKALSHTGFDGPIRLDHGRAIWGDAGLWGLDLSALWEACERMS